VQPSRWLFLLRVASLLGLAVSVMVLIDYSTPEMAFCSSSSGCGAVRDSGLGFVALPSGQVIPYLPLLGVLDFAGLFAGSLLAGPRLRHVVAGSLALAGGVAGLVLLLVQAFWIGRFCSLCLLVDGAALIACLAQLFLRRSGWEQATELVRPLGWLLALSVAVAAPLAFKSVAKTAQLPPAIAALRHPDRVTVIEFFDYQCPHCRLALPELKKALLAFGRPAHVVRQPIGLPGHELGVRGARMHVCAAEQGESETVLRVLIAGGPELSEQQFAELSREPRLNHERLATCLASDRPDRALSAIVERIKSAEFLGLPTTYIGSTRILGSAPYEVYLDALEGAAEGRDERGLPPWLYWLLATVLAGSALWLGRARTATAAPVPAAS